MYLVEHEKGCVYHTVVELSLCHLVGGGQNKNPHELFMRPLITCRPDVRAVWIEEWMHCLGQGARLLTQTLFSTVGVYRLSCVCVCVCVCVAHVHFQ